MMKEEPSASRSAARRSSGFAFVLVPLLVAAAGLVLAGNAEAQTYSITLQTASDPPGLIVPGFAMDGGATTIDAGGFRSFWVQSAVTNGNLPFLDGSDKSSFKPRVPVYAAAPHLASGAQ